MQRHGIVTFASLRRHFRDPSLGLRKEKAGGRSNRYESDAIKPGEGLDGCVPTGDMCVN
jgi:hypothetical protein